MKGRSHRTAQQTPGKAPVGTRWLFVAGTLILCLVAASAFAQRPADAPNQDRSERGAQDLQNQSDPPQDADRRQDQSSQDLLTAQRRKVLTMLLEQLRQRQDDTEAALREQPDGTQRGRALHAEKQALDEQARVLERQLQDLSTPGRASVRESDKQTEDPARRQEELRRRAQELRAQLRQSRDQGPEWDRRQAELDQIQDQMRDVSRELADLQRQRLRENYLAAVHAREQARQDRARPEAQAEPRTSQPSQAEEQANELAQQQEELDRLAQVTQTRLQQVQQQMNDLRDQMQDVDSELAELNRRQEEAATAAPLRAREGQQPQKLTREPQMPAQPPQQPRAPEAASQAPDHRQQELQQRIDILERDLRQMQQQQEQVRNDYRELQRNFAVLRDVTQGTQHQARTAYEDSTKRREEAGVAQRQNEDILRQQRELGDKVGELEHQLRAAEGRGGGEVMAFHDELGRIHAALGQVQQRLTQIETKKPEPPDVTRAEVKDLRDQVRQLQEDLTKTRAVVDAMLSQTGRSTVGSAGYTWGW